MTKVYTAKEIATVLGVGYRLVLEIIKRGEIKTLNIKGKVRISQFQLDEYLKGDKDE